MRADTEGSARDAHVTRNVPKGQGPTEREAHVTRNAPRPEARGPTQREAHTTRNVPTQRKRTFTGYNPEVTRNLSFATAKELFTKSSLFAMTSGKRT